MDTYTQTENDRFLDSLSLTDLTGEDDHWFFPGNLYDQDSTRAPRVFFNGRVQTAARVAFELDGNTIPVGKNLARLCDERLCVRPSHHRVGAKPKRVRPTFEESFNNMWVARVRVSGLGACHLWTGSLTNGYGRIRFEGREEYAHRVSWQLAHPDEELPTDKNIHIAHLCEIPGNIDSRSCVNATHLKKMTAAENFAGSPNHFINVPEKRMQHRADPTKCKKGLHDWTPENLVTWNGGHPTCRPCVNARAKAAYDAKKAAKVA